MGHLPVSFNLDGDESIWIHAVSVGEALTARALDRGPARALSRPKVFLSTTTLTGQQMRGRGFQGIDAVFYFPFDLPIVRERTLRLVRPRLFIMMETEIWPNLLRALPQQGREDDSGERPHLVAIVSAVPAAARAFFRRVLADVDRFCMQSDESARRIIDIGADPGARDA